MALWEDNHAVNDHQRQGCLPNQLGGHRIAVPPVYPSRAQHSTLPAAVTPQATSEKTPNATYPSQLPEREPEQTTIPDVDNPQAVVYPSCTEE